MLPSLLLHIFIMVCARKEQSSKQAKLKQMKKKLLKKEKWLSVERSTSTGGDYTDSRALWTTALASTLKVFEPQVESTSTVKSQSQSQNQSLKRRSGEPEILTTFIYSNLSTTPAVFWVLHWPSWRKTVASTTPSTEDRRLNSTCGYSIGRQPQAKILIKSQTQPNWDVLIYKITVGVTLILS